MENVADGRWEDLGGVDLGVFEGEWFDAWDVQGYLEERWGCRFEGGSSFAECLVEDEDEGEGESPGLSSDSSGSSATNDGMWS